MELPHFLDHLEEASLVITPGDRSDIMIGTIVADAATSYPGVAGVILTGGFKPVPQITAPLRGPETFPCPHPLCEGDTFVTATTANSVYAEITPENRRKIAGALGVFESHVDLRGLEHRINVLRSSRVNRRSCSSTIS